MTAPGLHRLTAPLSTGGITGKALSYTPTWNTVNNNLTPANGGTGGVTGRYCLVADLVFFEIIFNFTNVTNFGTGQYTLTLPYAASANYAFRNGGLHENANHYPIMLDIDEGATLGDLWYTASNGEDQAWTHNSPHVLQTTNFAYISGIYLRN